EAFASKAVGDGVAVKPTDKTVVSPAAGTIVKIFNTNHAFCLDNEGHFNGSRGSWFIPLQDKQRYLTWSQLGLTQQTDGLVSNV
ncbi:PTS glucose transporter subunit IIA, partial [Salmonella enterica subsp. enterica serovar Montevideo]|nr:PTS glucose transporter subunit IIA [Salmonella enterica subsp. enterica serovar Montevideo]